MAKEKKKVFDTQEEAVSAIGAAKECPKCGKWIHARTGTCPNCQTVLIKKGTAAKPTAKKAGRPRSKRTGRFPCFRNGGKAGQ